MLSAFFRSVFAPPTTAPESVVPLRETDVRMAMTGTLPVSGTQGDQTSGRVVMSTLHMPSGLRSAALIAPSPFYSSDSHIGSSSVFCAITNMWPLSLARRRIREHSRQHRRRPASW